MKINTENLGKNKRLELFNFMEMTRFNFLNIYLMCTLKHILKSIYYFTGAILKLNFMKSLNKHSVIHFSNKINGISINNRKNYE